MIELYYHGAVITNTKDKGIQDYKYLYIDTKKIVDKQTIDEFELTYQAQKH